MHSDRAWATEREGRQIVRGRKKSLKTRFLDFQTEPYNYICITMHRLIIYTVVQIPRILSRSVQYTSKPRSLELVSSKFQSTYIQNIHERQRYEERAGVEITLK